VLEACPLALGDGQAPVEVPPRQAERALHGGDEAALAEGVRQVVLEGAGDAQRFRGHLAGPLEEAGPLRRHPV
jgi:hypothetical protein